MLTVVKYFYEEPAALEVLTPDADPDARQRHAPSASLADFLNAPRYHRGYLAATTLPGPRVGLTASEHADLLAEALVEVVGPAVWQALTPAAARRVEAPEALLADPGEAHLLVASDEPRALPAALASADRRHALDVLRPLLAAGAVAFFAEPAHDGHDWSVFAARPLREAVAAALVRHRPPEARLFVLPHRQARSEEKFYFEQYDIDRYAEFEL